MRAHPLPWVALFIQCNSTLRQKTGKPPRTARNTDGHLKFPINPFHVRIARKIRAPRRDREETKLKAVNLNCFRPSVGLSPTVPRQCDEP